MGRSYWFECGKCGYRAKVSGRLDRGLDFFVQTILCRDCKELYDAVTRLRVALEPKFAGRSRLLSLGHPKLVNHRVPKRPPSFLAVLNQLPRPVAHGSKWLSFQAQCPVSALHRVQPWTEPDKCPRCGLYLEKSALPYRVWD